MSGVSPDQQSLRDMVDAVRAILGKDPLYCLRAAPLMEERCHQDARELPGPVEWKDWFRVVAVTADTRESFREGKIGVALRRKALRFEARGRKA